MRRHKNSRYRPSQWDLPGGKIDVGESYAEGAAREIAEEAGLKITPLQLDLVYSVTNKRGDDTSIVRLFYTALIDDDQIRLSQEHEEYAWLSPEEAIETFDYPLQKDLLSYLLENQLLPRLVPA